MSRNPRARPAYLSQQYTPVTSPVAEEPHDRSSMGEPMPSSHPLDPWMKDHSRIEVAAVLVLWTLSIPSAVAQAADDPIVDRVGTLALSQELDARGNLGGVTVDKLGFLYVANFRDAVWRISPEGEVETLSRSLYGASGNAVDSRGDLYQASFLGDTITKIARTGEVRLFATEGLEGPVGIAVDPEDDALYVCNCRGNTISRVTPAGEVEPFAESERFACPNGIVFGPEGDLYVTNFNHHDVLRIDEAGEVSVFATVPGGAGNAHLAFSKNFFYVTKIVANRVVKVSTDGEVHSLAGTGQPGHDDGPAPEATFHRPNGIAVSPRGDVLYVNTLVGEYNQPRPATVTVRTIEITTLTDVLEEALEEGGVEALAGAYERYSSHPVRGAEDTVAEMVTLGFRLLSNRQVPAALRVFELNAEANPDAVPAIYNVGEAYRYTGQTEKAVAAYRRVLELEPDHKLATSRLAQLEGDG